MRKKPIFLLRNLSYLRKEFDSFPSTIQNDLNFASITEDIEESPITNKHQIVNLKLKFFRLHLSSKNIDEYIKQAIKHAIDCNKITKHQIIDVVTKNMLDYSYSYIEVYLKNEKTKNKISGDLIGRCSISDVIIDNEPSSNNLNNQILDTINTMDIQDLDLTLDNKIQIRLTLIINLNKILRSNNPDLEKNDLHDSTKKITITTVNNMSRRTWTADDMKSAIKAVRFDGYSLMNASRKFSVPSSTLCIYLKNNTYVDDLNNLKSKQPVNNGNHRKYSITVSDKKLQSALELIRQKEKLRKKSTTDDRKNEIDDLVNDNLYSSAFSTTNKEIKSLKEFFVEFTLGKNQQSKRINIKNNFISLIKENGSFDVQLGLNDLNDEYESDLIINKSSVPNTSNLIEFNIIYSKTVDKNNSAEIEAKHSNNTPNSPTKSLIENDKMEVENNSSDEKSSYLKNNVNNSKLGIIAFCSKTNAKFVKCPFCKNIRFKHLISLKMHLSHIHIHFNFNQSRRVVDGKEQVIFEIVDNESHKIMNKLEKYRAFLFYKKKLKKNNSVDKIFTYLKHINNKKTSSNLVLKNVEEDKAVALNDQNRIKINVRKDSEKEKIIILDDDQNMIKNNVEIDSQKEKMVIADDEHQNKSKIIVSKEEKVLLLDENQNRVLKKRFSGGSDQEKVIILDEDQNKIKTNASNDSDQEKTIILDDDLSNGKTSMSNDSDQEKVIILDDDKNNEIKNNCIIKNAQEEIIDLNDQITEDESEEEKQKKEINNKRRKSSEQSDQNQNDKQNCESKKKLIELDDSSDKNKTDTDALQHFDKVVFSSKFYNRKKPSEINYDSDDEKDPEWLKDLTKNMLNDFNDVNEGEKEFMKLWNLFTMRNECIADCQLISILELFVKQEAKNICSLNLFNNFLLHLANLCDYDLINPNQLLNLINLIN